MQRFLLFWSQVLSNIQNSFPRNEQKLNKSFIFYLFFFFFPTAVDDLSLVLLRNYYADTDWIIDKNHHPSLSINSVLCF